MSHLGIRKGMVGPRKPVIVLFGLPIMLYSFGHGGWGATLAHFYSRQVKSCFADMVLQFAKVCWMEFQAGTSGPSTVFPKDSLGLPSLVIDCFGGNDLCKPHPQPESICASVGVQ